jgi:hypothetical protein
MLTEKSQTQKILFIKTPSQHKAIKTEYRSAGAWVGGGSCTFTASEHKGILGDNRDVLELDYGDGYTTWNILKSYWITSLYSRATMAWKFYLIKTV